jgi:LDH2 family malate/lactate/ureidoglycolate dehydrogenase
MAIWRDEVFGPVAAVRGGTTAIVDVRVSRSRAPRYLELFESGQANAWPNMTVDVLRPAIALIDAGAAPGPVALTRAVDEAVTMARSTGAAWVAVRGTVHAGAIGHCTERAAQYGMAGLGIVAGVPNTAYPGGNSSAVATSPLSVAAPDRGVRRGVARDSRAGVVPGHASFPAA